MTGGINGISELKSILNAEEINLQNQKFIKISLVKLEDQLKRSGYSHCVLYTAFLSGLANHLNIPHKQVVYELSKAKCTDFEILNYYISAQFTPQEIISYLYEAKWGVERICAVLNQALDKELLSLSTPLHIVAFLLESKLADVEVIKIMLGLDCFVRPCISFLLSCNWTQNRLLQAVIAAEVINKHVYDTLLMEYNNERHWTAQSIMKKMDEFAESHVDIIRFFKKAEEDDEMIYLAASDADWSDPTVFKAYFDAGCPVNQIISLIWRFNVDVGILKEIINLSGLTDEQIFSLMLNEEKWRIGKVMCLFQKLGRQPKVIITIINSVANREMEIREALNCKRHCPEKCSRCPGYFKGGNLVQWRQIFERSIDREAIDELLF